MSSRSFSAENSNCFVSVEEAVGKLGIARGGAETLALSAVVGLATESSSENKSSRSFAAEKDVSQSLTGLTSPNDLLPKGMWQTVWLLVQMTSRRRICPVRNFF